MRSALLLLLLSEISFANINDCGLTRTFQYRAEISIGQGKSYGKPQVIESDFTKTKVDDNENFKIVRFDFSPADISLNIGKNLKGSLYAKFNQSGELVEFYRSRSESESKLNLRKAIVAMNQFPLERSNSESMGSESDTIGVLTTKILWETDNRIKKEGIRYRPHRPGDHPPNIISSRTLISITPDDQIAHIVKHETLDQFIFNRRKPELSSKSKVEISVVSQSKNRVPCESNWLRRFDLVQSPFWTHIDDSSESAATSSVSIEEFQTFLDHYARLKDGRKKTDFMMKITLALNGSEENLATIERSIKAMTDQGSLRRDFLHMIAGSSSSQSASTLYSLMRYSFDYNQDLLLSVIDSHQSLHVKANDNLHWMYRAYLTAPLAPKIKKAAIYAISIQLARFPGAMSNIILKKFRKDLAKEGNPGLAKALSKAIENISMKS